MRKEKLNSLIFTQIFIQLDIAPHFTTVVDGIDVELGLFDLCEVEVPKYAGGVADKRPEFFIGSGKLEEAVYGQVGRNSTED